MTIDRSLRTVFNHVVNLDPRVSRAELHVVYDGDAVRSGSMDVKELAPALLSIGALCEEANRTLNGDRAQITVNVRAGFERGSFEVTLEILQTCATSCWVTISPLPRL